MECGAHLRPPLLASPSVAVEGSIGHPATDSPPLSVQAPDQEVATWRCRQVYCGASVVSVCRGMRQSEVAQLFSSGLLCVRAYKPLTGVLHACSQTIFSHAIRCGAHAGHFAKEPSSCELLIERAFFLSFRAHDASRICGQASRGHCRPGPLQQLPPSQQPSQAGQRKTLLLEGPRLEAVRPRLAQRGSQDGPRRCRQLRLILVSLLQPGTARRAQKEPWWCWGRPRAKLRPTSDLALHR